MLAVSSSFRAHSEMQLEDERHFASHWQKEKRGLASHQQAEKPNGKTKFPRPLCSTQPCDRTDQFRRFACGVELYTDLGNTTLTTQPLVSCRLLISIDPPCASAIWRQRTRPTPLPLGLVV